MFGLFLVLIASAFSEIGVSIGKTEVEKRKDSIYSMGFFSLFIGTVFFFLIATPVGLVIFKKLSDKISVLWQVGKFGVIGVLNTLVDWGVLAILILAFRKYFIIESSNAFIFG